MISESSNFVFNWEVWKEIGGCIVGGWFSEYVSFEARWLLDYKPSQAKRKSTSPCLLAIPAFDRIAGLYNRHLNSNRGICLR